MARNLYDVDDRQASGSDAWLQEREDRRTGIVPMGTLIVALLLAGALAWVLKDLLPGSRQPGADLSIRVSETFTPCGDDMSTSCLISANEFMLSGKSYRIADISVPSLTNPQCPAEARLADQSRRAMLSMMNGGAFEARKDPTESDSRARILLRDNVSLGSVLIAKGLARSWSPAPVDWCEGA
ncbi:endonuclease YncB(thermonuclease family) [Sphingobium fontiphilum]|uniref:Endonuclease YncB(Thermonuclease family) n=1 Tax=Sphingobium fontiphilum TaxID=944425 RepID=A0A7W6GMF5_9SPHN|nr:nuclease [Sphingobium fontiphilum]MBB3981121.1 endonuclease YncB(thermonuclease family) [Sphingobium fontiphilum]